jgi:transposase
MRRTEALQGVRMAVFLNLLHGWESAELNQAEAAELLGVSEWTFRRLRERYEEDGEAGWRTGGFARRPITSQRPDPAASSIKTHNDFPPPDEAPQWRTVSTEYC